jgi:hypothetical protein
MTRNARGLGVALLLTSTTFTVPVVAAPTFKVGTLLFVEVFPDGSWDFGFTPSQTLCSSAANTSRGMVQSSWVGGPDIVKQMLAVAMSAYVSGRQFSVQVDDNPGGSACKANIVVIQTP